MVMFKLAAETAPECSKICPTPPSASSYGAQQSAVLNKYCHADCATDYTKMLSFFFLFPLRFGRHFKSRFHRFLHNLMSIPFIFSLFDCNLILPLVFCFLIFVPSILSIVPYVLLLYFYWLNVNSLLIPSFSILSNIEQYFGLDRCHFEQEVDYMRVVVVTTVSSASCQGSL